MKKFIYWLIALFLPKQDYIRQNTLSDESHLLNECVTIQFMKRNSLSSNQWMSFEILKGESTLMIPYGYDYLIHNDEEWTTLQ